MSNMTSRFLILLSFVFCIGILIFHLNTLKSKLIINVVDVFDRCEPHIHCKTLNFGLRQTLSHFPSGMYCSGRQSFLTCSSSLWIEGKLGWKDDQLSFHISQICSLRHSQARRWLCTNINSSYSRSISDTEDELVSASADCSAIVWQKKGTQVTYLNNPITFSYEFISCMVHWCLLHCLILQFEPIAILKGHSATVTMATGGYVEGESVGCTRTLIATASADSSVKVWERKSSDGEW